MGCIQFEKKGQDYIFYNYFVSLSRVEGEYKIQLMLRPPKYINITLYASEVKPKFRNISILLILVPFIYLGVGVFTLGALVVYSVGYVLYFLSKLMRSIGYLMMFMPKSAKKEIQSTLTVSSPFISEIL